MRSTLRSPVEHRLQHPEVDLVERGRGFHPGITVSPGLLAEAADEIRGLKERVRVLEEGVREREGLEDAEISGEAYEVIRGLEDSATYAEDEVYETADFIRSLAGHNAALRKRVSLLDWMEREATVRCLGTTPRYPRGLSTKKGVQLHLNGIVFVYREDNGEATFDNLTDALTAARNTMDGVR